jgi:hypothetical protein
MTLLVVTLCIAVVAGIAFFITLRQSVKRRQQRMGTQQWAPPTPNPVNKHYVDETAQMPALTPEVIARLRGKHAGPETGAHRAA